MTTSIEFLNTKIAQQAYTMCDQLQGWQDYFNVDYCDYDELEDDYFDKKNNIEKYLKISFQEDRDPIKTFRDVIYYTLGQQNDSGKNDLMIECLFDQLQSDKLVELGFKAKASSPIQNKEMQLESSISKSSSDIILHDFGNQGCIRLRISDTEMLADEIEAKTSNSLVFLGEVFYALKVKPLCIIRCPFPYGTSTNIWKNQQNSVYFEEQLEDRFELWEGEKEDFGLISFRFSPTYERRLNELGFTYDKNQVYDKDKVFDFFGCDPKNYYKDSTGDCYLIVKSRDWQVSEEIDFVLSFCDPYSLNALEVYFD